MTESEAKDIADKVTDYVTTSPKVKIMRDQAFDMFKTTDISDETIESIFKNAFSAGFICATMVCASESAK